MEPNLNICRIYFQKGDLERALCHAKKAIMMNELRFEAFNIAGQIFMMKKETRSSLMFFEKSINLRND